MRIELENLEGGKGDFAHVYQPEELNPVDERISLIAPATVTGKVRLAGNEVFVNGHVETRAQVECDRCLQPVETAGQRRFRTGVHHRFGIRIERGGGTDGSRDVGFGV